MSAARHSSAALVLAIGLLAAILIFISYHVSADPVDPVTPGDDGITQELTVTHEGDVVHFEWQLVNATGETISWGYGHPDIEFIVREDGEAIWYWTDDRVFTMEYLMKDIEPGESISFGGYWDEAQPGEYTVEAVFTPTEGPEVRSEAVPFTVE